MTKKSNVVILGSSGFVGSALLDYFSVNSKERVVWGRSLPMLDLRDSDQAMSVTLDIGQEDTLICCAAIKRQFGDSSSVFMENLTITQNIGKIIRQAKTKSVIYFSSAAVYGEETNNKNINEITPVDPVTYYGISKFSSERLLTLECANTGRTRLIILRPPLIFGSGDLALTYGPSGFTAAARQRADISLWGDGAELRDFLYIKDVCVIVDTLLNGDFEGVVNAASGTSVSFRDVVEILRRYYPDTKIVSRPRTKPKVDNAFDISLLKKLLPEGFQFTSLDKAIEDMLLDLAGTAGV